MPLKCAHLIRIARREPVTHSRRILSLGPRLCNVSLAFLDLFQRLHRAVQGVLVVSPELGVCAFE